MSKSDTPVPPTQPLPARRTRFLARAYIATILLAAVVDLAARGGFHEPIKYWLTSVLVVLLIGWSALLSGRAWAWRLLAVVYAVLMALSGLRLHALSAISSLDQSAVPAEWVMILAVLWAVWVVAPLLVLATDQPARWQAASRAPSDPDRRFRPRTAWLVAPVLALGVLCVALSPPWKAAELDDVREAVLRYQFEHNGSGLGQDADAYYISLRSVDTGDYSGLNQALAEAQVVLFGPQKDPSDSFLARFSGSRPPARKVSSCTQGVEGVLDKQTKRLGVILEVGSIRWISRDLVEVKGGYFEGGVSASGNTYRVARKNGRWKVISDRMDWISEIDRLVRI